jgi:hypothetical protein
MEAADRELLARLLTLAGLIAATAEYSHIIRRRARRRQERDAVAQAGLGGLVRLFLADDG